MLFVATVMLVSVAVVGCSPDADPSPTPTPTPTPTTPTPSDPSVEVIEWVGQAALPSGMPPHEGLTRLSQKIGQASQGQLNMTAHPAGAVVPATEEWQAVDRGVLDFCAGGASYMASDVRFGTAYSQLPAGMPPIPNLIFHRNHGAEIMNKWFEIKGFDIYDIPGGGFHGLPETWIWANKPINGLADLQGLKMRASGDAGEVLAEMGVGPVFMPLGEVFEAMQRGVIDAFEVAAPNFDYMMGMHEAADYAYLSPSRAPTEAYGFLVNTSSWEALPDHLKVLVTEAARAEAIQYNAIAVARDGEALQAIMDYGVTVAPLPSEIDERFVELTKEFYASEIQVYPELAEYLGAYLEFASAWEELYGFAYPVMTSLD